MTLVLREPPTANSDAVTMMPTFLTLDDQCIAAGFSLRGFAAEISGKIVAATA
jgi:hypothetical protein